MYVAFVNPAITTQFWFSKRCSRLEVGNFLRRDWELNADSTMGEVMQLEPGKRIWVEWDVDKNPTRVEGRFSPRSAGTTFVNLINSGFSGVGDKIIEQAMGSSAGFGLVLARLKAYLEYGIKLNLVEDRFRDQLVTRPTAT
jgi:uncharacterized protein YndB with AHSA1/START domain